MRNKLYLFCLLAFATLISSCSESPLSDIELEDPSLLNVTVQIAQDFHNHKEVQVFLSDKNNRAVELLNGWVEVNGAEAWWERAEINSFGERGYIYYPDEYEHEFTIAIHLNPYDVYWFDLNPETGFPGFVRNYPYLDGEEQDYDYPFYEDTYYLFDMPFRNGEVKVSYQILRR